MPGRSLDQIWRQMQAQQQAQRQAEAQRQAAQQRAINEQRERARQDYLLQMKMNERLAPTAAAASAAAGAGGAGNRNQDTPVVVTGSQQAALYYRHDSGVLEYFVYNFEEDLLTDMLSLAAPGSVWSVDPVQNGGFFVWVQDSGSGVNRFFFIDLSGEVLWSDENTYGDYVDIENFSRYVAPYYEQGSSFKLVVFSGSDIREFLFDNHIEGGGYAYDDVSSFGFIVREDLESTQKYYMIRDGESEALLFKEVPTDSADIYQYAFSDKVVSNDGGQEFVVYGSDGAVVASFDYGDAFDGTFYISEFSMLSDEGSFVCLLYNNDDGSRLLLFFSGSSGSFSWKTLSGDYDYEVDFFGQKDYNFPTNRHSGGAVAVLFYDDSGDKNWNGVRYFSDAKFLPIWSTDSELRDFFTFSYETGIVTDYDEANVSPLRSEDHILLLVDSYYNTIFYFSDAGTFSSISNGGEGGEDGDNDSPYNVGNVLFTDGAQVGYTHTQLTIGQEQLLELTDYPMDGTVQTGGSPSLFGGTSSYFTNMYPGLFLLAAHDVQVDTFGVTGSLNDNPGRQVDTVNLQIESMSQTYQVFAKRVYGSGYPAINQIMIVDAATASGITQLVGSANSDYHELQGLSASGVSRIYYIAIATKLGAKLTDDEIGSLAYGLVNGVMVPGATTQEVLEGMEDYLAYPDDNYSVLRFNRTGDATTLLPTSVTKTHRIDDDDLFGGGVVIQFEKRYDQTGGSFGWDDLSDVETRRYAGIKSIYSGSNGSGVLDKLFVMKDTVNDKYWAIDFTQWTGGGGGGFAYTRRLIEGGTFSGPTISFTHSNYGSEVDVIEPGVLEITRGEYGPVYNSAMESESNGENPKGTLWNADGVYEWTETTHVIINATGSEVDSLVTQQYDNYWDGGTYLIMDDVNHVTYVSNNAERSFTQIESSYGIVVEGSEYINESLINEGNIVLTDFPRFRLVTGQEIFDEIVVDTSGIAAKKYDESLVVFANGFTFAREDDTGTTWFFYNLSSVLVGTFLVPPGRSTGHLTDRGKRLSLQWESEDGNQNFVFFNGDSLRLITTQWPYDSSNRVENDNVD